MHANIDVHIRRLIADFPIYGVKFIAKVHSYCANMNFSDKSRYDRIFQQVTPKGGESIMNYIKIFQNAQAFSVSVGKNYSGSAQPRICILTFVESKEMIFTTIKKLVK